ncbi:MAG: YdiU family protein [Sphingomonadales bacterium]|nr:YdiU family protein [Sphingomonadales bacterium]
MNLKPVPAAYNADLKITSLGSKIGDPVSAADFPQIQLRFRNDRWAASVGLADLSDAAWLAHFGRFEPLPGNLPEPLALRYHGHQFRNYNPEIGDGRGFLFAQMRDGAGRLMDLGTKGSGTTPYSRGGDGRLTLKGGVREILATEMLEALGVETSKSFSLIETGEALVRGDEPSPTRSAVLVRLSHSHIRIGTFQRIAFERDEAMMRDLVRYCMTFLYNNLSDATDPAALLHLAVERIADQAAAFMVAGFVHGVLNTDNINITGESFDYGPWRFTPFWDPHFTAAYFDEYGLYAFGRQAETMHWNLGQLAVALRLICDAPPLIEALERFPALFQSRLVTRFLWRLGITSRGQETDRALVEASERAMIHGRIAVDTFFHAHRGGRTDRQVSEGEAYDSFLEQLSSYESAAGDHPYWQGQEACSLLIDEVEGIWDAIAGSDNWTLLNRKISAIRQMGEALALD